MSKVNPDQSALPERLAAKDVMRRLGGITRATLTRWMNAEEARKRRFTEPFPVGIGEQGLAKTWLSEEVERWIADNLHVLDVAAADVSGQSASLPLGRVIEAVEKATEGAVSKQNFAARIERSVLSALQSDPELQRTLKSVKVRGDEVHFDFGSDKTALVKFLLRYR